jgi:ABC-type bacteriocin/lantibiotic exporter with double-glycine peptidase domain
MMKLYTEKEARRLRSHFLGVVAAFVVILAGALAGHTMVSRHSIRNLKPVIIDPSTGCGVVSLSLVSHWIGVPTGIDTINDLTDSGESGVTSLLDLKEAAHQMGLVSEGVRVDPLRPIPWRSPMILHVQDNHFLAALPLEGDRLVVVDPPNAPAIMERSGLSGDWDGVCLVVARSQSELNAALQAANLSR